MRRLTMEKPNFSHHSAQEFKEWEELGSLVISPKFQRREVWKTPARSYFIDSILRDIPIPPIFLRLSQSAEKKRVVREVIDGQQRLRALLDFMADKYALSKSIEVFGGRHFSDLPADKRRHIETFTFLCEVFQQISDPDVLEVFARVNTYSVGLNDQELRNGRFFGVFKQTAYRLAHEHLEFWRTHRIFSESSIARMLEVELTSELMILSIDGQQDKKKSVDSYYKRFDEGFDERKSVEMRFRATIDAITEAIGFDLKETEFRRVPLFYSLFAVIQHRMFGVENETLPTPKKKRFISADSTAIKDAVIELSDKISAAKENRAVAASDAAFINACLRQTDNIRPRETRFSALYNAAFKE